MQKYEFDFSKPVNNYINYEVIINSTDTRPERSITDGGRRAGPQEESPKPHK